MLYKITKLIENSSPDNILRGNISMDSYVLTNIDIYELWDKIVIVEELAKINLAEVISNVKEKYFPDKILDYYEIKGTIILSSFNNDIVAPDL